MTLIKLEDIASIMVEHEKDRSKRVPQRRLAQELVEMIHGPNKLREVENSLGFLYQSHEAKNSRATTSTSTSTTRNDDTSSKHPITSENAGGVNKFLPRTAVENQTFPTILVAAGLASSKSEANRMIIAGGAYVGSQPGRQLGRKQGGSLAEMGDSLKFLQINPWHSDMTKNFILDGDTMILRAGKWRVRVIKLLPDAEFLKGEHSPVPGWPRDPNASTPTKKTAINKTPYGV